jgi:hypothetical protein
VPLVLPFRPSIGHYSFETSIEDVSYSFRVRWNEHDAAWYFDIYDSSGTSIELNVKVVIGTYLGRTSNNELFKNGILAVFDTANNYEDAGFDDLGTRVEVRYYTTADLVNLYYSPGGTDGA